MRLAPKDLDKLVLHGAGVVAQKRLWRGIKLNYPEAIALIATQLLEFIREGESVAVLMDKGKNILGISQVMPAVVDMVDEVQVEGTFPDGVKLVTVHHPICQVVGKWALYGSGLEGLTPPVPELSQQAKTAQAAIVNASSQNPGEYLLKSEPIILNANSTALEMDVVNSGDRPIQVGSHYPFFETNSALQFDREMAFDKRLDIPSGTAMRFEPGEKKRVRLIALSGARIVFGGNALTSGALDGANRESALARAVTLGFSRKDLK